MTSALSFISMPVVLNHDLFYIIYNNRKVSFRNVGGLGGDFFVVCLFWSWKVLSAIFKRDLRSIGDCQTVTGESTSWCQSPSISD